MINNYDDFILNKEMFFIIESLNSPVDIKWSEEENIHYGKFIIDDNTYVIKCVEEYTNIWTYKFYLYKDGSFSPELEKTRKSFTVLSTVRQGMYDFIDMKNPDVLIYGATDKSEGRKKLYFNFLEELSDKYDYDKLSNRQENYQIFVLYKNIDKKYLYDVMKQIIENEIDL